MAAVVESATPKGAAGRFEMLQSAVRANPGWQSKDSPRGKMSEDTPSSRLDGIALRDRA